MSGGADAVDADTLEYELQRLEAEELFPVQPAETAGVPPGRLDLTQPAPPDGPCPPSVGTRRRLSLVSATRTLSGRFVDPSELDHMPDEKGLGIQRATRHCCSKHTAYRYMIDPFHPFNTFWDYILAILCIYVAISIPFRIGFQVELCPADTGWWVELTVDLLFALDIVLNFRTGIVQHDGVVDLDPKSARSKYLRSWFVIDFLSVLPVTYIALAITGACAGGTNIRAFKVVRLVRLLKMLKLAQLRNVWALWKSEIYGLEAAGKVFQVLAAALLILYMCHLVACIWFYAGTIGADAGEAVNHGWIAKAAIVTKTLDADTKCAAIGTNADKCETDVRCVLNEGLGVCEAAPLTPLHEQYLESFYWAITVLSTVGFGDITPITKVEKMFSILAELIGCVCFALMMGSLANLFQQNALDSKVSGQVEELVQYCQRKHIPKDLVRKVVVIMEESYRQEAFSAEDMMKRLPYGVRTQVETYTYRNLLTRVPLFREHLDEGDMSASTSKAAMQGLTDILDLFKTLVIQPGETVYCEGDPAFDFYIVIEGEVELSTIPATRLTHDYGSFFGERELFFSAKQSDRMLNFSGAGRHAVTDNVSTLHELFGRHRHHTATVVSKSRAKLKFIRWDQLLQFLTMKRTKAQQDAGLEHPAPKIFRRIRDFAIHRHRLEEQESRQRQRPTRHLEISGDTKSVVPMGCAAYDCFVATRAAKKLQQQYRQHHKRTADNHREAARKDILRLEESHQSALSGLMCEGSDMRGAAARQFKGRADTSRALFLELLAGQREMKEVLSDLQARVQRIEERSKP